MTERTLRTRYDCALCGAVFDTGEAPGDASPTQQADHHDAMLAAVAREFRRHLADAHGEFCDVRYLPPGDGA